MKRGLVLAVMALVTAWSIWAMAQAQKGRPLPVPAGSGRTAHPIPTARPTAVPTPTAAQARRNAGAEGAEEATQEKKEEAEDGPPADINWTDFGRSTPPYVAMVINFAILAAGYYWLGKKPIALALKARRDKISREIEEAQKMRLEAEKRAQIYLTKLERLEDEVKATRDALTRAGEAERERIVADAEAKAERMRKDAEFLVEQELKQVRLDLQRDTVEAAIHAAEELLKKRVTQADQERLAEDYLADLTRPGAYGGQPNPGGAA